MPEDPNAEFVYVRLSSHDDTVLPGRVTRLAYDTIWQHKGYTIVPDAEAELLSSPVTQAEMRAATAEPASEPEPTAEATTTTRKKG